ncbi:7-carboxy-7-deazaguanine synthase [uncultured Sphingomonas sp.]|uniref:7-carboxy-7-deazaguanine synthase n=1 Tax=uncultured Sphingomonas sp. TaxID=158754 RepID=UPI0025E8F050|nr:7-carboxy-7-deazaguanine synthase [uncultured Sphingomonas sp.]
MTYSVKEMFLTLQGEGVHAGRRAVFVRFAGCNLWTGREQDRATAVCRFCDTDFVGTDGIGGGKFADAAALVAAVVAQWGSGETRRFVVLTGGEPMLQVDDALVETLHDAGFTIAIESNGTIAAHPGIDWVCVSPKAGSDVVQRKGDELKLVWPQEGIDVDAMERWDFAHHLVQPMDAIGMEAIHRDAAVDFAMDRPKWRLSLQTHKLLGLR